MFRRAVVMCASILALAALPVVANAADAPVPAPTPAPTSSPTLERFLAVDGAVAGITYNEVSPGRTTTGFGVRGGAEFNGLGHTFFGQVSYRSYSYQHSAAGTTANGLVFGCPTSGDQGCITPIGAQVYDNAFSPGPVSYLNATTAQDSTTQIGLGVQVANPRLYASLGYVFRTFNFLNYPGQSGFGAGLDLPPSLDRTFSVYGDIWFFFRVHAGYTGPSSAALGTYSAYPFSLDYHMYTYRVGATYRIGNSPLFADISTVGERADPTSQVAPLSQTHNVLAIGAGLRF